MACRLELRHTQGMVVFLNGKYLPGEEAVVSVTDRSFLYGDGLYETLPFYGGVPFRWSAHLERLQQGLKLLRIKLPFSGEELKRSAMRLLELNEMRDVVLRLTVSRGGGPRGYSMKTAQNPVVVMTLHPLVEAANTEWRLITSSLRVLADDPLMQSKTCSKVRSVLARAEAEDQGADEALLLNERGEITEGAATNFFCIQEGVVCTPPLAAGLLPGVTRAAVLEVCAELGIKTAERPLSSDKAADWEGAFVTVSTMGIVEVVLLDGDKLRRTPVVGQIREQYWQLVHRETRRE
jgi:branched-subunit amino acid aminotransferase/4-amino-4-deoxychorismate lyase